MQFAHTKKSIVTIAAFSIILASLAAESYPPENAQVAPISFAAPVTTPATEAFVAPVTTPATEAFAAPVTTPATEVLAAHVATLDTEVFAAPVTTPATEAFAAPVTTPATEAFAAPVATIDTEVFAAPVATPATEAFAAPVTTPVTTPDTEVFAALATTPDTTLFATPVTTFATSPFAAPAATPVATFPYRLTILGESLWAGGSVATLITSLALADKKDISGYANRSTTEIPFFDFLYTTKANSGLNTASDVIVFLLMLSPGLTLPGLATNDMVTVGIMYAETVAMAYGTSSLIKSVALRYRPFVYATPQDKSAATIDAASSFPSRHATLAFATAFFTGTIFDATHPNSAFSPWIWGGSIAIASGISVMRVISGDHFVSDVVAGAAIGSAIGFFVPFLHRQGTITPSTRLTPSANGLALTFAL